MKGLAAPSSPLEGKGAGAVEVREVQECFEDGGQGVGVPVHADAHEGVVPNVHHHSIHLAKGQGQHGDREGRGLLPVSVQPVLGPPHDAFIFKGKEPLH